MFTAIFGSIEAGSIYAIMALGVFLSYRILDFPDLTVDGSFVTGAAVSATMIVNGYNPFLATFAALFAGMCAGFVTGILHTKGKINALLSGILMMIALYSINLRIMGKANVSLLDADTIFTYLNVFLQKVGLDNIFNNIFSAMHIEGRLPKNWTTLFFTLVLAAFIKYLLNLFFKTEIGLAVRATGDNKRMIRSFSANTDNLIILGLGISNALVALSGALIAQYGAFADVGLGIGIIIIGLASVIIGETLIGTKTFSRTMTAVLCGAIIYRIILTLSLRVDFLDAGDARLVTATIVIAALIFPNIFKKKTKRNSILKSILIKKRDM